MMGHDSTGQEKLFTVGFSLEKRVRADHPLRKIAEVIDFNFIYDEVADKYGRKNVGRIKHVFLPSLSLLFLPLDTPNGVILSILRAIVLRQI
jgi:hypothetical protein